MDNLISKKELLSITGISYGQLYRWKREGLIPEEWFNKQSSFTGQETFFPREEILARISSIVAMKDSHSLEELASILSSGEDAPVSAAAIRRLGATGVAAVDALGSYSAIDTGGTQSWRLAEVAFAYGLMDYAITAGLSDPVRKEIVVLIRGFVPALGGLKLSAMTCTLLRASGTLHAALSRGTETVEFDPLVVVIVRLPLGEIINTLKKNLSGAEPTGTKGEK